MSAFGGKADIAVKLLTRDDARRIAVNIAKLPELSLNSRPTELRAGGPLLLMDGSIYFCFVVSLFM
jgi:hypothetical protein